MFNILKTRQDSNKKIIYDMFQNIMTFNKCSIAGKIYGEVLDKFTGGVIEEPLKVKQTIINLKLKFPVQNINVFNK